MLQLWIRDMKSGAGRQVTTLTTQPQGATWSPDGKRIVFFNVDGMWRVAEMSVLDVATGTVTKIHDSLPQPGTPTWSPDGKRIALAGIAPMTRALPRRHQPGADDRRRPAATTSGTRRSRCCRSTRAAAAVRCGRPTARRWRRSTKACSRCGRCRAAGEPLGPPRRVTSESAHSPSWQGDSRHILYQSLDTAADRRHRDRRDADGAARPARGRRRFRQTRIVVHAGRLLDMKTPTPRTNVDIIIDGNRIRRVVPHAAAQPSQGGRWSTPRT